MPPFKQFEDIPVWQAARNLVKAIYRVTRTDPFAHDRGLVDQIRRAAVSITSNIAEGHERGTSRDLILFLYYAKGSAGEVRSQLWNAEDAGYLNTPAAAELRQQAHEISRQIYGWVASMQAPDFHPGPAHQQRQPLRQTRWEQILDRFGVVRLPNGRCVHADELEDNPAHPGEPPR